MAAVYLHNALHAPDPSPPSTSRLPPPPHLRHSSATTVSTETSYTHLPQFDDRESTNPSYQYLLSRQPPHPDDHISHWETALSLAADPPTADELRWQADQTIRGNIIKWRMVRTASAAILFAWTIYTVTRYFVAFYQYKLDPLRQHYILAFGSASALTCLGLAVSFLAQYLQHPTPPVRIRLRYPRFIAFTLVISTILTYLGSITLFCVSVANLVLTVLWRHSFPTPANPEPFTSRRTLQGRCTWDIDVVWTGTGSQCVDGKGAVRWGFFLAGNIVRLVVTGVALIIFHAAGWEYRKASRMPTTPMYARMISPRTTMIGSRPNQPPVSVASSSYQRHRKVSSGTNSQDQRLSRGSATLFNVPESLEQEEQPETPPMGSKPPLVPLIIESAPSSSTLQQQEREQPIASTSTLPPATPSPTSPSPEQLQAWAAEFRSMVDQVENETEDGLAYARYDKYNVRIVGGLVRRLSTIESVEGSERGNNSGNGNGNGGGVSRKGSGSTRKESWGSAKSHQFSLEAGMAGGGGGGVSRKGSLSSSSKSKLSRKESVPSLSQIVMGGPSGDMQETEEEEGGESGGDGESTMEGQLGHSPDTETGSSSEVWMDARSELTVSREGLNR